MYPCIQTWIDLPASIYIEAEAIATAIVVLGAGINQSAVI
jgi:hypothetical protein